MFEDGEITHFSAPTKDLALRYKTAEKYGENQNCIS